MVDIASVTIEGPDGRRLVVTAHHAGAIEDDAWVSGYWGVVKDAVDHVGYDKTANLVFAEGKGPSGRQRNRGNAMFDKGGGYELRVAVVTASVLVRGTVTALRWFNPHILAVPPERWSTAVAHVGMSDRLADVVEAAAALRGKLGEHALLDRFLAAALHRPSDAPRSASGP
jgi:hypothetical protein